MTTTLANLKFTSLDAAAPNGLSSRSNPTKEAEARRAAEGFESLMLNQLTAPLQRSSEDEEGGLFGGGDMNLYRQMMGEQLASSMSKNGGVGIADMIMRQLNPDAAKPNRGTEGLSSEILRSFSKEDLKASLQQLKISPAAMERAEKISSKIDRIIEEASERYGLNPNLVSAVINRESSARQFAESPKGASGYMQLMPATFKRFAGEGKDIFDAKENINAGAAFLRRLSDKYDGNIDKILAGYNAGEGNVDKYGGIPPFKETRNFVAAVKNDYAALTLADNLTMDAGPAQNSGKVVSTPSNLTQADSIPLGGNGTTGAGPAQNPGKDISTSPNVNQADSIPLGGNETPQNGATLTLEGRDINGVTVYRSPLRWAILEAQGTADQLFFGENLRALLSNRFALLYGPEVVASLWGEPNNAAAASIPPSADAVQSSNQSADLSMPVEGPISSKFGEQRSNSIHQGIDIAVPQGTPIGASAAGRVVFAGWNGNYGNTVLIKHSDGRLTRYAHADQLMVSPGDQVESGQTIATSGATGNARGAHLHFEVLENGSRVNPLTAMKE